MDQQFLVSVTTVDGVTTTHTYDVSGRPVEESKPGIEVLEGEIQEALSKSSTLTLEHPTVTYRTDNVIRVSMGIQVPRTPVIPD